MNKLPNGVEAIEFDTEGGSGHFTVFITLSSGRRLRQFTDLFLSGKEFDLRVLLGRTFGFTRALYSTVYQIPNTLVRPIIITVYSYTKKGEV